MHAHSRPRGIAGLVAAVVLAASSGGCAGGPPVSSKAAVMADTTVRQAIAKEDRLVWASDRLLTWTDFRGTSPHDGVEGALTGYSLLFGVSCTGSAFAYEVSAVFLPHQSWVKPIVLADPDERRYTLRHEQTHFDLTEVHARRVRKLLREVYDPCRTGHDSVRTGPERVIAAEADVQRRYDDETRHGLDRVRQRSWDQDVADWLSDLEMYRGR